MSNQPHQDIKHNSRLLHLFPQDLRPYVLLARLERPIGVWLLLIPGLWAIALAGAGNTATQIKTAILFAIGSIVMRAAGCVINDIWDRDLDKSVERTATRP
ncbi:MAG TPA: 4-hydroxybenzoate octaprenyltransferase, partial [Rhodospirillaceae bacterium]|nr:4-hydroxybenzoate octaprenyltransferase [Rhodospirillaceae bacterium]